MIISERLLPFLFFPVFRSKLRFGAQIKLRIYTLILSHTFSLPLSHILLSFLTYRSLSLSLTHTHTHTLFVIIEARPSSSVFPRSIAQNVWSGRDTKKNCSRNLGRFFFIEILIDSFFCNNASPRIQLYYRAKWRSSFEG